MTKYKLEDFESWLETDQQYSGMTKDHWEHYLEWYKENPGYWKLTIEKGLAWRSDSIWKDKWNTVYVQSVDNVLWNTILKWKYEVDCRRPTTLQEYLDKKYLTSEIRENVREINSGKINQERRKLGSKPLKGGELDLSEYKNLEKFNENDLGTFTELILEKKPYLKELCCSNNLLTSLDASGCPNMRELDVRKNELIFLNISNCSNLKILYCSNNQLTSLDVSGCDSLKNLECFNNQLTSLNVSQCSELTDLWCDAELFTESELAGLEKTSIIRLGGDLLQKNQVYKFICNFFVKKHSKTFPEMELIDTSDLIESTSQFNFETIDGQILACCLEVQNRLYENKEEAKCQEIDPKISQTHAERKEKLNKVLSGEIESLSRLQDLPYLKEEFCFPSTKIFRQRIKTLEGKLTTKQKEIEKLKSEAQQERDRARKEIAKLEQKIQDLQSQEREKQLAEINNLQEKLKLAQDRVKKLERGLRVINTPTSKKTTQTDLTGEDINQKDLKIEELQQRLSTKQNKLSIKTTSQLINPNPKDSSWADLSAEAEDKPLSPSQIREREKQKKRQSQEQSAQIQVNLLPKTPPKK